MTDKYRHVTRGTVYTVVGEAVLQQSTTQRLGEGDRLTVYIGEDGLLWARPVAEFHDGRFEVVS